MTSRLWNRYDRYDAVTRLHMLSHALSDIASGAWRAPLYGIVDLRLIYKRFRPLSHLVLTCLVITHPVRILLSNYADKTFFVNVYVFYILFVCEHAC